MGLERQRVPGYQQRLRLEDPGRPGLELRRVQHRLRLGARNLVRGARGGSESLGKRSAAHRSVPPQRYNTISPLMKRRFHMAWAAIAGRRLPVRAYATA